MHSNQQEPQMTGRYSLNIDTPNVKRNLASVSQIISHAQDKTALFAWKARVGEKEANKISNTSCVRGTAVHKLNESYLLKESNYSQNLTKADDDHAKFHKRFKPVLELTTPLVVEGQHCVEKLVYWKDKDFPQLSYAGTLDLIGSVDFSGLSTNKSKMINLHTDIRTVCIDWKNLQKKKQDQYLINYYIQLAAYVNAFNYVHPNNPVKEALLVTVTSRDVYIYYLDETDIHFYTQVFTQELIPAYLFGTKYDWNALLRRCGIRWDDQYKRWVTEKINYLGKKLYIV